MAGDAGEGRKGTGTGVHGMGLEYLLILLKYICERAASETGWQLMVSVIIYSCMYL